MKVLMINGSPRVGGNTETVLLHMKEIFEKNDIDVVKIDVPANTEGCRGCRACRKTGKCAVDDAVNEASAQLASADGLVVGSPVYFSGISGNMKAFMDRFFYSYAGERRGIVGGSVVAVRRAGGTAALDQLNHYLLYGGFALASSTYWPMVFGNQPGEVEGDAEGMQTAENLASNMIFMMKSLALGKEQYGLPEFSPKILTNFIR